MKLKLTSLVLHGAHSRSHCSMQTKGFTVIGVVCGAFKKYHCWPQSIHVICMGSFIG